MDKFLYLFLTITFVLHGVAFTVLGLRRRKTYYFILTGTFLCLTAIYLMKFEEWAFTLPASSFPLSWLLRIGATLCTLIYFGAIYKEKGSWLWRVTHLKRKRYQ